MPAVAQQVPPTPTPVAVEPPPPPAAGAAAGDPAILGLPMFVVGSVALAFALVGYVSPAAAGSVVPILLMATGLGLIVSAVWAAALGQTLVACIRLPAIFTAIVGLVVVALILLVFGTLNTDETLTKAAGYVVFAFAALGIYAFLGAAWVATGGKPLPLGPPLVH